MNAYNSPEWTDDILLDLIRLEDDRAAFAELYDRYWGLLINLAYQRLKSRESAEELVQDLFVNLFIRRQEIKPQTTLEAYLKTALRNQVFRAYHSHQAHQKNLTALMSAKQIVPSMPDELMEVKQLREKIDKVAERLPDKCREVFIMSRFEQRSHQDIAEKLNISVSTVKKHLTKALNILRTEIKDHQLDLLAFYIFLIAIR